jgi:ATPase subunit of ABC transporter with duplicated ATPase domains
MGLFGEQGPMSIIVAERIAKSFDPQDVFWDVSCSVARGDRIALVGRNGTGKTTLLRILAGFEAPNEGRVHRARGLRIGFSVGRDDDRL